MKKKEGKYLKFYKECMETGKLPIHEDGDYGGLCFCLDKDENFTLLKPINDGGYWAYDGSNIYEEDLDRKTAPIVKQKFTTLRQTIVLFMAAMNNEL